ncbi:MAG: ferritin-like domain-containing protein [Nitrospirae bacterium]|nr:ferritin-like domain-containing protein [Nitrospirota bacterium]
MDIESLFNIFKVAIENESSAAEFYQNAAQNTSDPESKKIFEEFAKMESYHLNKLKERYAELRKTAS